MLNLSDVEQALWDAVAVGQPIQANGEAVRAEVIAALALGAADAMPGRVPAVRLSRARIDGELVLSHAEVRLPVELCDCEFEQAPRLGGARVGLIDLSGSRLPALDAPDLRADGPVRLNGCRVEGDVRLTGARVAGTLDLSDAELHGDPALRLDSATIERDLVLSDAVVRGEALMWSARIGGTLVLNGTRMVRAGGVCLNGDGLSVGGGLFLERGFEAQGEVRLQEADVGRKCVLSDARLSNPGGCALNAERLKVHGSLVMHDRFEAEGEVNLFGAAVDVSIRLDGARLSNPGARALSLRLVTVGSAVYATKGFTANGEVAMAAARFGGSLVLAGARLSNPGGRALWAARLTVQGAVFADDGFEAEGEIVLSDAKVNAGLYLTGARLRNAGGRALAAWGLACGGIVECCEGFRSDGKVSFAGARIGSELCFKTARIDADLSLRRVSVPALRLAPGLEVSGTLDLRHAQVGVFEDDPAGGVADLLLDGFSYDILQAPLPVKDRLGWLARDVDGYQPQPYEQLAAVYRRQGHDAAARSVLLAKQRRRSRDQPPLMRLWDRVQDWTVGYGYRPFRAAIWFLALLSVATVVFGLEHPPRTKPGEGPQFNPFLFALDLLLPIISFGQEGAFSPRGWWQWFAAAMIAAGWILATTVAAGVSRSLSRQ